MIQIYKHLKTEIFAAPSVTWKRETKIKKFCELIFQYCNSSKVSVPSDMHAFLCSSVTAVDDKKTMQKKIAKKYGDKAASLHKIRRFCGKILKRITHAENPWKESLAGSLLDD